MLRLGTFVATALLIALANAAFADGPNESAKRGAAAYRLCASCHSLRPGVSLSGPSLANLWGRKAGTTAEYGRYTDALKGSGIAWDENTLNAWLADPQAMVPGTTMTFRGIPQNDTRGNLIEFLRLALADGGATRVVQDGLITAQLAEGQIPEDVSALGPNQRIKDIHHCRDAYYITTADGARFPFWETNVRLKIDTSGRGPKADEPVLLRSGMVGDRVSVVFSNLSEIARLIAERC
jgi:cytochrome c